MDECSNSVEPYTVGVDGDKKEVDKKREREALLGQSL